jgi:phage tail sheath gpL-like
MAKVSIIVKVRESAAAVRSGLNFSPKRSPAGLLDNLLNSKVEGLSVQLLNEDGVSASGTITFSGTGAADDTVLINGVEFTAVAADPSGNQYLIGADEVATAEDLRRSINASASALVRDHVVASAAAGVLTITAKKPGLSGNCITIAEGVDDGDEMEASGARLEGGTEETAPAKMYSF